MSPRSHRAHPAQLACALLVILSLVSPALTASVAAAPSDGVLRIEPITAYNFVVDSNVETPATYAPEAATIGARFCNDGATDLANLFAYVGNYDPNSDGD